MKLILPPDPPGGVSSGRSSGGGAGAGGVWLSFLLIFLVLGVARVRS